ncbi:hypothetical protein Tco_0818502 [Tanacetum coccineum]
MDNCHSIGTPLATKPKLDVDLSGEPDSGFELTAFSDADHAGCLDTRKSTSGGIQFLGDKLVSWMSKKQNCTAMSSARRQVCGRFVIRHVVLHSNVDEDTASRLWLQLQQNTVVLRLSVENGIIELYFVRTEYQLADMFTKALPEDRFKYLVRRILLKKKDSVRFSALTLTVRREVL